MLISHLTAKDFIFVVHMLPEEISWLQAPISQIVSAEKIYMYKFCHSVVWNSWSVFWDPYDELFQRKVKWMGTIPSVVKIVFS